MNKRGVLLPTLALALLLLILYAITVKEEVNEGLRVVEAGKPASLLVEKDQDMEEAVLYYDQSFKLAVRRALLKLSENGGQDRDDAWRDENFDNVNLVLKRFIDDEIKKVEPNKISLSDNYTLSLVEGKGSFVIEIKFSEKLVDDDISEKAFVDLARSYSFREIVDFDLDIFKELYKEYGNLKKCSSRNELFDGKTQVSCVEENDFINFEVETKNLGLVKPKIKFRIEKPGKLFT